MNKLVSEVQNLAEDILNLNMGVTSSEALRIAAQIQQNRILLDAFMLDLPTNDPSALEAIVMGIRELNQDK